MRPILLISNDARRTRLLILRAIALLGFVAVAFTTAVAQALPARFCLKAVENGVPTAEDYGQPRFLVTAVALLPGISRPIIYARGKAWTIDESDRYVLFGGSFPVHNILDSYARDDDRGIIAGVSPTKGLFSINPGEHQFQEITASYKAPLQFPYSVIFVPRWKRFVISDATGLFSWMPDGNIEKLSAEPAIATNFSAFDLPSIKALLVSTSKSNISIRADDGRVTHLFDLIANDFVLGADGSSDGNNIVVRTYRQTIRFDRNNFGTFDEVTREAIGNLIQHPFDPLAIRPFPWSRHNPSNGRTVFDTAKGLMEIGDDGSTKPMDLPFNIKITPIIDLMDMPASHALIVFTSETAYALGEDGKFEEVDGAPSALAGSKLKPAKGVIPVRNEMIVLGPRELYLLVDTRVSGNRKCS